MMTADQFETMRYFILRHGDLLTRRRLLHHFEGSNKQGVLDALACYQNEDGGFGNGLELDILCPESSGICTEVAFGYFLELGVHDGPLVEQALAWVLNNERENGDLPHPVEALKRYPHGEWWEKEDNGRIMSIAGLLGKMGISHPELSARAAVCFEKSYVPFPDELGVYSYPLNLYLEYADGAEKFSQHRNDLRAAFPAMMEKEAWHHPLFFCHDRWASDTISSSLETGSRKGRSHASG